MKLLYYLWLLLIIGLHSCDISVNNHSKKIESQQVGKLEMTRDTSHEIVSSFNINFPERWNVIPNYKGAILMGISPLDSIKSFRENISVQLFTLNKYYEPKEVAEHLFKQMINDVDSNCKVFNQEIWESDNRINFYKMRFQYAYKSTFVKSILFVTVNKNRAYIIVCTSNPEKFENTSKKFFYPTIQSFSFI